MRGLGIDNIVPMSYHAAPSAVLWAYILLLSWAQNSYSCMPSFFNGNLATISINMWPNLTHLIWWRSCSTHKLSLKGQFSKSVQQSSPDKYKALNIPKLSCGLFWLSLPLLRADTVMVYETPALTERSNDVVLAGSVSLQLSPSL